MDILTDEIVEKAASAAYADMCEAFLRKQLLMPRSPREWDQLREEERGHWRSRARACLEAILPDVVEKCAQIAEGELTREGRYRNDVGSRQRNWVIDGSSPYGNGRLDSAASIRSLLNKEDNANV